ncbi:MAG: hypothetical protein ABI947_18815 [Chloroflexota bacterium]
MYETPSEYKTLCKAIDKAPETVGQGKLLVNVEAVLTLAEALGLADEPITVGWVLLAGTPTPNERLNSLTPDQRRMIANARQFIPLNSRFAWEAALVQYAGIKAEHRNYNIVATDLDTQIIGAYKSEPLRHPAHIQQYEQMLATALPFRRYSPHRPKANETYTFTITTKTDVQRGEVRFEDKHIAHLDHALTGHWFDGVRPRQPFSINLKDLKKTAKFLDNRERELGNRVHWAADLAKIHYQHVEGVGIQACLTPSETLDIDGFFHMAGIVSSGKTTLAILIAAHVIRLELDMRITFVVGDTNTAVQLAHRFNVWFCNDPAENTPVAVPVLGQSTREVHLKRLLVSREYQSSKAQNVPHWGERWLNPVCPLQALVSWDADSTKNIPIGKEPCQRLQNKTLAKGSKYPKNHVCPLFAICPSKQMYRDMPTAKLWITTPGALSQSGAPHHLEERPIKIGDLVYEQSDLVIFDEAETIVDWFDGVYANNLPLTDGESGLLDRLDDEVAEYLKVNRAAAPEFQRWLFAERAATKAISGILTSLDQTQGRGLERLRMWVKRGHFTRNNLSYRLSRRLAGLKEFESRDDLPPELRRLEDHQTRAVLQYFEELDQIGNPLVQQLAPLNGSIEKQGGYALADIMQQMNSAGLDVDTEGLITRCEEWLDRFFPEVEPCLVALKVRLESSESKVDRAYVKKDQLDRNKHDLALRLFFTLWVVVLDWHLGIVVNEWHRKPADIGVEQPYAKIPKNLRNILPIPATGAQYGLYRVPKNNMSGKTNHLTQFVHVNIGRAYVLNFHRLRTDLDGLRGPNVLAMSGTSYLPDSSRFNLQVPPHGVLSPDQRTREGMADSRFEFKPFYDDKNHSIAVSGVGDKLKALLKMVRAMLGNDGQSGGFLGGVGKPASECGA